MSTVLADPEVKSHNISGVIEYSGFNDIKGVVRDFANTNVRKIIAYNEGVNTHMGVIRNDKGSKPDVNQKILDEIISTLG